MDYALQRLIDLAKKTGDRLIIHDPYQGRDVVIMDVDEYEKLALNQPKHRGQMSETELLDQIDHDIALWRDRRDTDEFGMDGLDEMVPDEDPWHSAASVLAERDKEPAPEREPWAWEPEFGDTEPIASEAAHQPVAPVATPEPNEWHEEPLNGDEPVFYEEPV